MTLWLLYMFLGIMVGTVAGLFGIGGGILMVPSLFFALKASAVPDDLAIFLATRTSLAIILFTSFFSALSHHKHSPLLWNILKQLSISVILGTLAGTYLVSSISGYWLEIIFMIYVTLIALKMWFGFKIGAASGQSSPSLATTTVVGFIIGLKSAILGIGGGTISIPYLTWQKIPMTKAVGLSAALGFIIALFGTSYSLVEGFVHPQLPEHTIGAIFLPGLLGVTSTSIIMAKVSSRYAHKLPQEKLRKAFAVILAIVAFKSIYKFVAPFVLS
jgi:uncharacterized membrane protein YfcA